MFGLAAIPSVIQTIGFLFMPDTPRWLVARGRLDKARAVLHRIHGTSVDVDQEIANINNSIQQSAENRKLPCRLGIKVIVFVKVRIIPDYKRIYGALHKPVLFFVFKTLSQ